MILEKKYRIPADVFREGYRAYQKKYVYPKNYMFMGIFLVLAANFVYGAAKAPDNYLAYLLIVICLAFAFREWYNPRKLRNAIMESIHEMGDPEYKLTVTEKELIFSTEYEEAPAEDENDSDTGEEELTEEEETQPEVSRLQRDSELQILEYDRFFLAVYGKQIVYIIPKDGFNDDEMSVLRNINK